MTIFFISRDSSTELREQTRQPHTISVYQHLKLYSCSAIFSETPLLYMKPQTNNKVFPKKPTNKQVIIFSMPRQHNMKTYKEHIGIALIFRYCV